MWSTFAKFIDRLSEWVGKVSAWLIPILIGELAYDTIARYLFNSPTEWSYDITYMLYGAVFMGGAAYTLLLDEHVRIEVIYEKVSPRSRAIIDAVGYVVFSFPLWARSFTLAPNLLSIPGKCLRSQGRACGLLPSIHLRRSYQ